MKPSAHTQIYEGELATYWFNREEGILFARAKSAFRSIAGLKRNFELVREITGNKKVCLLADTSKGSPQDKEAQAYSTRELARHYHAMAIISESMLGKLIANAFMKVKNPVIPMRMFSNEEEAKEWLKQFSGKDELVAEEDTSSLREGK